MRFAEQWFIIGFAAYAIMRIIAAYLDRRKQRR